MPTDREAALKKAEKLLRQGKLDGAIEEYVRLIDDQPRDFNSINALGDLYVRAGDPDRAVAQFTRVADHLFAEGFLSKAQALYKKALKVQPRHEHTLMQLAETASRQGLPVDARAYLRQLLERRRERGDERGVAECLARLRALEESESESEAAPAARSPEAPPEDPARLLDAAREELTSGNERQGRAGLMRVLTLDPGRHGAVVEIGIELARQGRIESGFGCVDVASDAALLGGDLTRAIDALAAFVRAAPHIPGLIKLVELCVDAGLDGPLREAQGQLADAYLDSGQGAEARVIAEDLLEQDPESEAHALRLRRAVALVGGEGTAGGTTGGVPPGKTGAGDASVEIDLSEVLAGIGSVGPPADDPYARALEHLAAGRPDEAAAALREAGQAPRMQAKAAAELGRLYVRRGDLQAGVEWLGRAADLRPETPEDGFAVLYELAEALERLGEPARALAILIDLDADSGGYRDARARIEQLARARTGSDPR
ncbi:MAG: tetratricopeptide repeat protein [Acidobacteria bacterium]|nr:tetratricopeptide repeat protein [Acidobacteriota bacterium]